MRSMNLQEKKILSSKGKYIVRVCIKQLNKLQHRLRDKNNKQLTDKHEDIKYDENTIYGGGE